MPNKQIRQAMTSMTNSGRRVYLRTLGTATLYDMLSRGYYKGSHRLIAEEIMRRAKG